MDIPLRECDRDARIRECTLGHVPNVAAYDSTGDSRAQVEPEVQAEGKRIGIRVFKQDFRRWIFQHAAVSSRYVEQQIRYDAHRRAIRNANGDRKPNGA